MLEMTRISWLVPVGLLAWSGAAAALPINGGGRVSPSDFVVTTFADGLAFPYGMAELADGSLLVGTTRATDANASGNFYGPAVGELLRLADTDGDGVADQQTLLATGLPSQMTDVRRIGSTVLVSSGSQITAFSLAGQGEATTATPAGAVALNFDAPGEHKHYATAVRPSAAAPGAFELYFNVGSSGNAAPSTTGAALSGLVTGAVERDSIYRVTLTPDGAGGLTGGGLTHIATGLRNAAGMAFDPVGGGLYFQDNGIDTPGNRPVSFSADELNFIAAADLGGAVEDFGFADTYVDYVTGQVVNPQPGVVDPVAAFVPLAGRESEGAASIAFAPAAFPAALRGGLFVGFHGQINSGGVANEENPLVWVDPADGNYFHILDNNLAAIGHPDGLLATGDSLYVADLAANGRLFGGGATAGRIYRITVIPEPGIGTLTVGGVVLLGARRKRRRQSVHVGHGPRRHQADRDGVSSIRR